MSPLKPDGMREFAAWTSAAHTPMLCTKCPLSVIHELIGASASAQELMFSLRPMEFIAFGEMWLTVRGRHCSLTGSSHCAGLLKEFLSKDSSLARLLRAESFGQPEK